MKQFLKECRECRAVSIFVLLLFFMNGIHMYLEISQHNFNLPLILRLLDVLR